MSAHLQPFCLVGLPAHAPRPMPLLLVRGALQSAGDRLRALAGRSATIEWVRVDDIAALLDHDASRGLPGAARRSRLLRGQ